ncbi:hypothetical protein SBOR_8164 [Sclerotinia borealis F-4128]|uniref:DUF6987 domain-containing protein n=1 Tax=Sclerotinia borealis (strain F-4128) TaxID=1432307 RepID=W9C6F8_SCLBF|nr:hypothetical protein SBOR_8164 [Sclerotinia borealis F-4128]
MTDTESSPKQTLKAPKDASSKTPKTPTKTPAKSPAPKSTKKDVPKAPSTPEPVQTRSEPPESPERMAPSAISDTEDHLTNGEQEEEDEEDEGSNDNGVAEGEEEGREEEEEGGLVEEEELTERDPNEDSRNLGGATEQARDVAGEALEKASHVSQEKEIDDVLEQEKATEVGDDVQDKASQAGGDVHDKATQGGKNVKETTESKAGDIKDTTESETGDVKDTTESKTGDVKDITESKAGDVKDITESQAGDLKDSARKSIEDASEIAENLEPAGKVNEKGEVIDEDGNVIGKVNEADIDQSKLKDSIVNEEGDVLDKEGHVIGSADPIEAFEGLADRDNADGLKSPADSAKSGLDKGEKPDIDVKDATQGVEGQADTFKSKADDAVSRPDVDTVEESIIPQSKLKGPFEIQESGEIFDVDRKAIGKLQDDVDIKSLVGKQGVNVDDEGNLVGENGTIIGKVDLLPVDQLPIPESVREQVLNVAIPEGASQVGGKLGSKADLGSRAELESRVGGSKDDLESRAEGSKADLKSQVPEGDEVKEGLEKDKGGLEDAVEEKTEGVEGSIEEGKGAEGVIDEDIVTPGGAVDEGKVGLEGTVGEGQDGVEGAIDDDRATPGGAIEEVKEGIEGIVKEGQDGVEGAIEEGKEGMEGVTDETKATPGGAIEESKEGAEGITDQAKDTVEGVEEEVESNIPPVSILEGLKVNKAGKIVDRDGNPVGQLIEGDAKKLAGKKCDKEGKIYNDTGKVVGRAEPLPEVEENESAPFEDFPGAIVDKSGKITFEGQVIGQVVEGDVKKMIGKVVDEDGDILDKNGNVIGKAERTEEEPEIVPEGPDYSVLFDKKVNKLGNVTDDSGRVVGRIIQGVLKNMIGRRCDKDGAIWGDSGKKIGQAEPIPDAEKEELKEPAPFEDFPDATVESNGDVVHNGEVIGKVIEGDPKKLKGKKVDADGDILSASGNVLGKAERWEAPEIEAVPEVDNSSLAGKRVNKAGNVVNKSGEIYGRVVEGDIKQLAGKMCDKQGFVRNEGGDIIGKCEVVPEGDREGLKEGPFTDFDGCTVNKEGKVVTSSGEVVGRLVSGDANVLFGRAVDDDGEIVDKNGNVLGRAERWQEEEVKKDVSPMSGRKVNKEGNVVDENGDIIGRLKSGDLGVCFGKKIDDDGDVVDQKGNSLGHVTLLEDIVEDEPEPVVEPEEPEPEPEPEPEIEQEPEETEEEKKAREEAALDKKICSQMTYCIEDALSKVKPILKMITSHIDKAERTPKDELDEEDLVNKVKPLIEEGGRILSEANASIRALDPGGRLASQAKAKTAAHEATPEEYHLADCLKELTGVVTETIENAKRKIEGMPHAKKEINPLWSLLSEPLAQILAAVGLLLSGVLGLVGKLLSGLGLGGLLDNLLGGLGLKNLLTGLGLGSVVDSLTGKKSKK